MDYFHNDKELLYLAGIDYNSVVDGPGMRTTVFFQGCDRHCRGCHNPQTWDHSEEALAKSLIMTVDGLISKIEENTFTKSVTLSGGEPLLQFKNLSIFIDRLSSLGYNIGLYTGFSLTNDILTNNELAKCVSKVNFVVDGPYVEELRSLELKWKGSKNQTYWVRDENDGCGVFVPEG